MIVQKIILQNLDFLVQYAKCCSFPLYQGNVTVEPRISINVFIQCMWLCVVVVLHIFGTGCNFSTGIERQHAARLVESGLPRDRHILYSLMVYISFNSLASSCIYAGWHVPDLVSPRTEFCDAVYMVQEGLMGYALRISILAKTLSKQTASNSNTYSRLNRHLSPGTMENAIFAY